MSGGDETRFGVRILRGLAFVARAAARRLLRFEAILGRAVARRLDAASRDRLRSRLYAERAIRDRMNARADRGLGVLEELALEARPPRGERVLVFGCGTGRESITLARRGCLVSAIDGEASLIAEAKVRAAAAGVNVDWIVGDARADAVPPASFDAVIVFSFLASMITPRRERARLLASAARALKPGGRAYFTILVETTPPESTTPTDPCGDFEPGDRWNVNETIHVFASCAAFAAEAQLQGLSVVYERFDDDPPRREQGFAPAIIVCEPHAAD